MRTRKILMACANHWTSPFQVGSHHLAREFVRRGYEVAFVSDPVSPFHLLAGAGASLRERLRIHRQGGLRDLGGKLWAYVPGALLTPHNKPLLRSRWVQRSWEYLTYPNVVFQAVKRGFGEVDLLYLDSPAQAFWLKYIQAGKSVLRVADNNRGFGKSTEASREAEARLARTVDAVVYTAKTLEKGVKALSPRSLCYLPNGVNFRHFEGTDSGAPMEYAALPGPIALYVGAIEEWFNFKWLAQAARKLPKVSFVLIGSKKGAEAFKGIPNVHFLGTRPYADIPRYIRHADVGMIPFDAEGHAELVNSIHPLKLYEYMACGLPVVASSWEELRLLKSPAILCRDGAEFEKGLRRALSGRKDRKKFIQYAKKQDWSSRADRLLAFLKMGGKK